MAEYERADDYRAGALLLPEGLGLFQRAGSARMAFRPANGPHVKLRGRGPACRSSRGTAVAANDVRRTEWRTATAVTPSRYR